MPGKTFQIRDISTNRAATAINRAGKNLTERQEDLPIKAEEIRNEVSRISEFGMNSVLPSDYCYNLINKSSVSFQYHLFEWLSRGFYRYLGPGYKYTGPVFWKGKVVGHWQSGKYQLSLDPRYENG
jgi:hypothetical protein